MMFRVIVADTSDIVITPFVRLKSDGIIQTVMFKPNDVFHVSYRLPDGEIFDVVAPEQFSPLPPNPLIQISSVFSLRRIDYRCSN